MSPEYENPLCKYYSSADWKRLRSISNIKSKDSTFVRTVLNILYRQDPTVILYRSLNGCRPGTIQMADGSLHYRAQKYPLTPQKRHIIRQTFQDRIKQIHDISEVEKCSRMSERHINETIALAINTIQRGLQNDQCDIETFVVHQKEAETLDF